MKNINLNRRKFIAITASSLALIALTKRETNNKFIVNEKQVIKSELIKINKFNLKREEILINNFQEAYISDLKNSRTIWVNKSLMTYADLWK